MEVKEKVNHGEFEPWIKKHCPFSIRSARNYMFLARNGSNLRLDLEANRQLPADLKTIDKVRVLPAGV
jgi:hypothetical protein